jgi:hypothetical protein
LGTVLLLMAALGTVAWDARDLSIHEVDAVPSAVIEATQAPQGIAQLLAPR